jgi:integrase
MAGQKVRITKRVVETAEPGLTDRILWDTELKGFGCKITPSGTRSYFLYYRTKAGRQRRPQIGRHGHISAEEARDIARLWLGDIARGEDPSGSRLAIRSAPTVSDLATKFLADHSKDRNSTGTYYNYCRMVERFVEPMIGSMKVQEVTRADISRMHEKLRTTPYQANRVLGMVSKIMNLAEVWGLRPEGTNPTRRIPKYKELKRERFLSAAELGRLGEALAEAERTTTEKPAVIAAIRLLVLTGCRLSEVLTLKWAFIDFERGTARLPETKTGPRTVHLGAAALRVLSDISRQDDNPYVLVGGKPGGHLVNLQKPWHRLRQKARIEDVRLHDLRHSYASIAAGLGEGLPMIGKLLGHTQASTTHRYAHLADDPVTKASARIDAAIAGNLLPPHSIAKR